MHVTTAWEDEMSNRSYNCMAQCLLEPLVYNICANNNPVDNDDCYGLRLLNSRSDTWIILASFNSRLRKLTHFNAAEMNDIHPLIYKPLVQQLTMSAGSFSRRRMVASTSTFGFNCLLAALTIQRARDIKSAWSQSQMQKRRVVTAVPTSSSSPARCRLTLSARSQLQTAAKQRRNPRKKNRRRLLADRWRYDRETYPVGFVCSNAASTRERNGELGIFYTSPGSAMCEWQRRWANRTALRDEVLLVVRVSMPVGACSTGAVRRPKTISESSSSSSSGLLQLTGEHQLGPA
jgi:hypothetical protein